MPVSVSPIFGFSTKHDTHDDLLGQDTAATGCLWLFWMCDIWSSRIESSRRSMIHLLSRLNFAKATELQV